MVAEVVAWVLLMAGAFFLVTGALGMVRLPDVFTRMHAAGMTDTMGAGLILAGMCVYSGADFETVRLLLILGFLWFTSPIATHATAKAALSGGVRPFTLAGGGSGDAHASSPRHVSGAGQSDGGQGGAPS